MTRIRSLTAMVHVASVARSAEFYAKLGFAAGSSFTPPGAAEPSWTWLRAEGAELMLARADEPVDAAAQGVLFYLYCDDVPAMKAALEARGVATGPVEIRFYAPRGEFRVADPDGYTLMVTHT